MKKKKVPMNPLLPGRYGRMTAEEWDREVEKFDQENIADFAEPLDKELKERLRRWERDCGFFCGGGEVGGNSRRDF